MKHKILVAIILSSFSAGCSTAPDCPSFKTGTFKPGTSSDIRVIRKETTQKEYSVNPEESFIDEYNINWLDECTYSATLAKTNKPEGHSLDIGDSMLIIIKDSKNDRYEWEGHVKGEIKRGIMIKIGD